MGYSETPTVGFVLSPELKTDFFEGIFRFDFFVSLQEGEPSLLLPVFDNPVYFKFGVEDFSFEYYTPVFLRASFVHFKKTWNAQLGFVGAMWNGEEIFAYTETPLDFAVSTKGNYYLGVKMNLFDLNVEPFIENGKPGVWIGSDSLSVGVSDWIGLIFRRGRTIFRAIYSEDLKLGFAFIGESGWIFIDENHAEGCWKVGKVHVGGKVGKEDWTIQVTIEF